VSLEKQEVPTLPEHLRSPLVFNGVFVARSLVFFEVLCRSLLMFVSLNNNTTDVTSVAETSNPSKAPELISVINGVRVCQFLDFCVVFGRSLFVLFRFCCSIFSFLWSALQIVVCGHRVH
jgi:hypothetical protein